MEEIQGEIFSFTGVEALSDFPSMLFLVEVLALLYLAKKLYGLFGGFDLEHQLVKADNKAVTIAFVGYLSGVALILEGVLESPSEGLIPSMVSLLVWGIVGIVLLNLAQKINDMVILRGIDNKGEKLESSNLAVGVAEAGGNLGSALIVRAVITGESLGLSLDVGVTIFYFLLGQLGFILFGFLYQMITGYDFLREIKENNVAAGISFGMSLAALGFLIAVPLHHSYSLVLFAAWYVVGAAVLAFFRFVMDRVIIPSEKLDSEIHDDQNWGIALLEGSFALMAVLFLKVLFLP